MFSLDALELLQHWGLDNSWALGAGIFEVRSARKEVYPEMADRPALVIPYRNPDGSALTYVAPGGKAYPFARLRWIDPPAPALGFRKAKAQRYTQPKNSGVQVYFPPSPDIDWTATLADPNIPIIFTEGEAKALVAAQHGFIVIALGGVFNFTTPGGKLLDVLEDAVWEGRDVYVVYDSDAATNPNVVAAEARLVDELQGKRGAYCHIVRLPAQGTDKMGLDDYLTIHGPDAFERLLKAAPALSPVDAKVIELNRHCAWIERENQVWDFDTKMLIRKESFLKGSRLSTEKHITVGQGKAKPKEVSIPDIWLTHRHAQRYSDVLFRPGEGSLLQTDNGPALNIWNGWERPTPGDVSPWLALNAYLFSRLPQEHRDLALKLAAYKAQHPEEKPGLAVMLVGPQGCGKTIWADSIRDAFDPYTGSPTPGSLGSEFQGWMEKALIATVHETTPDLMKKQSEQLKAMITELRRPMNEKYRVVRDINFYAWFIFTSNLRGIGAHAADDRRYFVVDCPPPLQPLTDAVWKWKQAGGGKHLLHYLLNYPLGDWKPPARAPQTAGKIMATQEARTPIQDIAAAMLEADENVIMRWLLTARAAADNMQTSSTPAIAEHGRVTMANIGNLQVRDFYSSEELTIMFPQLVESLLGSRINGSTPKGIISGALRDNGIDYLINQDDIRGFLHNGIRRQYLVIANQGDWKDAISQADFDRAMSNFPTFAQLLKRGPK